MIGTFIKIFQIELLPIWWALTKSSAGEWKETEKLNFVRFTDPFCKDYLNTCEVFWRSNEGVDQVSISPAAQSLRCWEVNFMSLFFAKSKKESVCMSQSRILNIIHVFLDQSGFYLKPTGIGKVGEQCNIFDSARADASTFTFLDWW